MEWNTIDIEPKGKELLFKGYQGLYIVAPDYYYDKETNIAEDEHTILEEITHWAVIKPPQ